ncbi:threonine/serine dehydratase [Pseudohalocynthiibacter aestuariivivens]|uniref:Threonine/serine dehydratase n=1 Tax=Pseudohalocynthiibacter aestuariivivens TaxID=1591409 RepID=A0ABV5JHV2_9RHOB|nr:threonine/serine dehydratase [Pseudohalocynthiibacter sp. F2068]
MNKANNPMQANPDQILSAPTLDEVRTAAGTLAAAITLTPLLQSPEVNARLKGRLLIKNEAMQRTGAFKFRGAYNRISQMSPTQKARGVITYSSGNHAQGVALAAKLLGTTALIVMPSDVPQAKMDHTRALGAEVVTFEREKDSSDDVVARLRGHTGRIIVPPSEDRRILAGGGTVPLEILQQAETPPDVVLVPCGGGGLSAVTALVMKAMSPETQVFGVEPALFDDTRRSLALGRRVENPVGRKTICDAIMTPTPNSLTFSINKELLAGVLTVTDDEVRDAMLFAFQNFKIVAEPGGAVGLAAVLSGKIGITGKTIAVVITGGNVDRGRFADALAAAKNS